MQAIKGQLQCEIKSKGVTETRISTIGDPVDCYRNLNISNCFSIRQRSGPFKGRVTGYAKCIVLSNPQIIISEAGRVRVIREKHKNVHAYVRGELTAFKSELSTELQKLAIKVITYRPYESANFFCIRTGEPVRVINQYVAVLFGSNVYLFQSNPFAS